MELKKCHIEIRVSFVFLAMYTVLPVEFLTEYGRTGRRMADACGEDEEMMHHRCQLTVP